MKVAIVDNKVVVTEDAVSEYSMSNIDMQIELLEREIKISQERLDKLNKIKKEASKLTK